MKAILMIIAFSVAYICIGVFVTDVIKNFIVTVAVVGGLAYLSYKLGTTIAAGIVSLATPSNETEEVDEE